MNNAVVKAFAVLVLVAAVSCKKHGTGSRGLQANKADTTGIVGQWAWVRSNFLFNVLTPQLSDAHKELNFTSTGVVYIRHNDSTGQYPSPYIAVPPMSHLSLLSGDVTDTVPYHFGDEPVGCPGPAEDLNATFMALVIKDWINQFKISNDTLYLVTPPCLIQPDSVVYVRVKGGIF